MDTKFCFGCATYKKTENMSKVKRGKIWRVMCQDCIDMKSGSYFGKKETDDAKKVAKKSVVQSRAKAS